MKTFVKLCCSIVRKNKVFTAGIFIMSVFSVAIAFLGANFVTSISDTLMGFIKESGMPDAVYTTDVMFDDSIESVKNTDGVSGVYGRFIYDTNIESGDGNLYSVRIFRTNNDAPFKNSIYEKSFVYGDKPKAAINRKFAEHNNIHPGDVFTIYSPTGNKDIVIESVISNPETLSCEKDDMSSYEGYQFAYIYMSYDEFNEIFPMAGYSNQLMVYFDEGLTLEEQKACMPEIRKVLGEHVISEVFIEESEALNTIRDDINTISVICRFIPCIVWIISLGFNFIFIKIIIENQKKTIGVLRALGFTIKKSVMVFVSYTVIVNIPAVLLGSFTGSLILRYCTALMADSEGIIESVITVDPILSFGMIIIAFLIGIAAALLSSRAISKIDPAEAYDGALYSFYEVPKCITDINTDAFFKISIVSVLRNYKRQIIGALCIAACIITMCVGFEGVMTIGNPINAVYGGRYRYDLYVRNIDDESVLKITEKIKDVEVFEPAAIFTADMFGSKVKVSTLDEESELTIVTDADGNRIFPKDGVIIDEMTSKAENINTGDYVELDGYRLKVTGIAREILYIVMYISPDTAAKMGYNESNCIMLRLAENADIDDVEQEITEINPNSYFAELSSQKDNIRNGFVTMRTVMFAFAVMAFVIGSLLIINITIIDFNENRYRYSILRALGAPVRRIGVVAAVQNISRVFLGIITSCPLCYICVSVLLKLLSGRSQEYVMVKYIWCFVAACLVSFLYVLIGMCISLVKIKKMNFTSSLNEME